MAHMEVTGAAAGAVGLAQFGPTAGGVEGDGEVPWIDEGHRLGGLGEFAPP